MFGESTSPITIYTLRLHTTFSCGKDKTFIFINKVFNKKSTIDTNPIHLHQIKTAHQKTNNSVYYNTLKSTQSFLQTAKPNPKKTRIRFLLTQTFLPHIIIIILQLAQNEVRLPITILSMKEKTEIVFKLKK